MVGFRTREAILAAVAAVAALAVPAAAPRAAPQADVTLQVVPRGQGTVMSDAASGGKSCGANEEPNDCLWTFPAGTTVVLSARPLSGTFSRWSTPDCPGTADCRLTLDANATIVALFGKLTLAVATSGADADDVVTSNPTGIDCPGNCRAQFDAGATVTLTVKPGSGFTSFPYGCASTSGATCSVTVLDEPQQVGLRFNNSQGPVAGAVVKVTVKVQKTGNGEGQVTASGLDCGGSCSASFDYGTLAAFTAAPSSGSLFGGWGGVCAADRDTRCTLPIGPITLVHPRFVRDTPPSAPGAISVSSSTQTSIAVTWAAATDDVGVKDYEVFAGDETAPRVTTASTSATIDGLACGKTYTIAVDATDTAGNRSPRTTVQAATAPCARPLQVTLVAGAAAHGRLVVRFRSTVAATGSSRLLVRGRVTATKKVAARAGVNTIAFTLPRAARGQRVRVVLQLTDPKGRSRTFSWSFPVGR